jgi:predicted PurR-regulated permease PerM
VRGISITRLVFQVALVVVAVAIALYLVYLLRKPIGWVLLAAFLAVALSGPVRLLERRMRRGFAIAIVYLGLFSIPFVLAAVVVPPIVTGVDNLSHDVPRYVTDLREFVEKNERLREIDQDYDITGKLQEEAEMLPGRVGDAAGLLSDIGLGLVNSMFALVTILVLTAFILGGWPQWREGILNMLPTERHVQIERVGERIATAVAGYVAGALLIAVIAGTSSFIVMTILGVPFAAPLAVFAGLMSLIPLIGATIAAVIIGVVTLFNDFPADTIIWAIWAVVYQQIENNLVQPQIQRRTVNVQPFVVLVAVLFGQTLLGVLGALVAIPIVASIQITIREWWSYRQELRAEAEPPPTMPPATA